MPLAGIFAVGIFTRRANTFGVIVGLFAGVIIAYLLHGIGGGLSLIHISEPTRLSLVSRMPSSA